MLISKIKIKAIYLAISLFLGLSWGALSYAAGMTVAVNSGSVVAYVSSSSVNGGSGGLTMRVGGPGDYLSESTSDDGVLTWYLEAGSADGHYDYDIYLRPEKEGSGGSRSTGSFEVRNGSILQETDDSTSSTSTSGEIAEFLAKAAGSALDLLVPTAEAANLTASSANPTINFTDTSPATRVAQIETSTPSAADANRFQYELEGRTDNNEVFDIDTDLDGDQSLVINTSGDMRFAGSSVGIDRSANRMGIGTVTPANDLHISANDPTIRLEDTDGATTWEINSNGTGDVFDFREILTGKSLLTLRGASGNVGVGTTSPEAAFHVRKSTGDAQVRVTEDVATSTVETMFSLVCNTCTPAFRFAQDSLSQVWFFRMLQNGDFSVDDPSTGAKEATFKPGGNLVIGGSLTQGSSRDIKRNIKSVDSMDVLTKLEKLDISHWTYNHTADDVVHMGPMAEDFYETYKLGDTDKGISSVDTAGVALAAIKALHSEVKTAKSQLAEKDQQINLLAEQNVATQQQLADLQQQLATQVKASAAQAEALGALLIRFETLETERVLKANY
ncbi:MAG: tail fiber domain-containing protein [Gammaproteobacteria bacterium]|nr:tail fiber domain-containing protein [Gammaproteobacteria bacterium]